MPQNSLNIDIVYEGRPVGNSPECTPLDMALNNNIKRAYDYHYAVTDHLDDNDVHKFSVKKTN